jgi:succinate dehydrogenase/fumarate reductase flavoprotein subunit
MDQIQVHPTGFLDRADRSNKFKILAPEALRGSGGILLNEQGRRFIDELTTRDKVTAAIFAQPGAQAFLLLDKFAAELFGLGSVQFYLKRGLASKCDSVDEIAKFISSADSGSLAESLKNTIEDYRESCSSGSDSFGKKSFPSKFIEPEFYVMEVVPVVHYCMGGLKIDKSAQVIDQDGRPVPGIFAAGEVTGGVHGVNRLAGNSLLECVVFGRIAGQTASDYIKSI